MAQPVRVQVYNSNIARMFVAGGDVNSEATSITLRILPLAKILSPKRSGRLMRSHRRRVVPSGIYGVRGYVEASAPHARYVHEGTPPTRVKWITPKRSPYLVLRPGNGRGYTRALSVQGQSAQPWLRDAANRVLLRYGVRATDTGLERI